jgi:hypothetical protein
MPEQENLKPNLSLTPCGGVVTRQGNERYTSLYQVGEWRNIPRKILLLARRENPPGLMSSGNIQSEKFLPWLQANYTRLEELAKDRDKKKKPNQEEIDTLQEQKLKEEILKLKNFNKSKSDAFISRKLVFETINKIKASWTDTLRQKLEYELPAKCQNLSQLELKEVMTKLCDELLYKFSTPISQWSNETKEVEEDEEE